jgi:hypothetical protein
MTTFRRKDALSFVIPSAAEGSPVQRTFPGNTKSRLYANLIRGRQDLLGPVRDRGGRNAFRMRIFQGS